MGTCICNACNYMDCDSSQAFCVAHKAESRGQLASIYVGASTFPTVARDDIIIKITPQAVFQAAAAWTSRAANYGANTQSGNWAANTFTPNFLKAGELAALIAGINSLGGGTNVGFTPAAEEVVKAADITKIYAALQTLQLNPRACDRCNTMCNTCNGCEAQCCCSPCN